ncbi:hypothetical protein DNF23_58685, partial [Pseudomonas syringae pv. pisi]
QVRSYIFAVRSSMGAFVGANLFAKAVFEHQIFCGYTAPFANKRSVARFALTLPLKNVSLARCLNSRKDTT